MIFYITKYAVTQGIIELDSDNIAKYDVVEGRLQGWQKNENGCHGIWFSYSPGEWYTEKAMAIIDADHRRLKKIESLRKKISKLESMEFK